MGAFTGWMFPTHDAWVCNSCFMLAHNGKKVAKQAILEWGDPAPIKPMLHVNDQKRGFSMCCEYCGKKDQQVLYKMIRQGKKK